MRSVSPHQPRSGDPWFFSVSRLSAPIGSGMADIELFPWSLGKAAGTRGSVAVVDEQEHRIAVEAEEEELLGGRGILLSRAFGG